jgi:AraC family transcriptional regulator
MNPKIVSKSGFNVVGFKYRGKNEKNEIPQLWQKYGRRFGELKHNSEKHAAYGVSDHYDHESGDFDYVAGVAVSSKEDQPADSVYWQIPEQTYAVFSTTLPTVRQTFDDIYSKWLPESGYRRRQGPEFEMYDERFDVEDPNSEFDIYIPIIEPD